MDIGREREGEGVERIRVKGKGEGSKFEGVMVVYLFFVIIRNSITFARL